MVLLRFAALLALLLPLSAADLPLRHVTLYKHGIAYFEREGAVAAGDQIHLDLRNADINDVLKSLTVNDGSKAVGQSVRYDSNEPLGVRLGRYPFQLGSEQPLATFLDGIKGARISLTMTDKSPSGVIMSARSFQAGQDKDSKVHREEVTVLLDSGDIATYDLAQASALRLSDARLQQQLKEYLQEMAQSRAKDTRSISIETGGAGSHSLRVSYIAPVAIWESSYRLSLDKSEPRLEGWAIVNNTTGEDWTDVQLSVVSGRPISFVSPLDTPRYGRREIAALPDDQAAGAVVYGGSVDAQTAPGAGGAIGGVLDEAMDEAAPARARPFVADKIASPSALPRRPAPLASTVPAQITTGVSVGELFQYKFASPITIKKDQSAMLPFFQDHVQARKLLIFTENDGEHPVNAAEITNTTGNVIDGGPVTVYDGGAYAGEALFETLKTGDKRLVGYAVDFGTRITTGFDSGAQFVREVHASNGNLEIKLGQRQTRTYTIRNVDAKPKTLIVQQASAGLDLVSPKPLERTADSYRFEVTIPAEGAQTLKVEQEQTISQTEVVTTAAPDLLLSLVENKRIGDAARAQLSHIAALKTQIAALGARLKAAQSDRENLTNDENRIRQNIITLRGVTGQDKQVQDYTTQLANTEGQITKLRDAQHALELQNATQQTALREAVAALAF